MTDLLPHVPSDESLEVLVKGHQMKGTIASNKTRDFSGF